MLLLLFISKLRFGDGSCIGILRTLTDEEVDAVVFVRAIGEGNRVAIVVYQPLGNEWFDFEVKEEVAHLMLLRLKNDFLCKYRKI